jgi:trehalose 6-phosphate phosphatase
MNPMVTTGIPSSVATESAPMDFDLPSAGRVAFFFDVDGTLLELRPDPMSVVADEGLRALLTHLRTLTQGAIALVSGRSLADIDRIFDPIVLPASGLHGAEMRYPDGSGLTTNPRIMDHARPGIGRFVAEHPGLMLEDKGATLAVHYRARPELGAHVLTFMNAFGPGDEIAVQEGKFVVELKPALYDKGTAIASLMKREPFHGRIPVFIGDDLTDEKGFALVNRRGGLSVRIGAPDIPTEAQFHIPNPAALRRRLARFAETARGAST